MKLTYIQAHNDAVKTGVFHEIIGRLIALADLKVKHIHLVKHSK